MSRFRLAVQYRGRNGTQKSELVNNIEGLKRAGGTEVAVGILVIVAGGSKGELNPVEIVSTASP